MQAVILCGGKGTRMREETEYRPKPMVEIGGMPILWHIMKIYSHFGVKDFILCLGYKGHVIKEYFRHFEWLANDFTLSLGKGKGKLVSHAHAPEDWTITFVDTGLETETGGRVKRIERYVKGDEFFLTYGDGVADIDIRALHRFHRTMGKIGTVTGIHPSSKYGILDVRDGMARSFQEKPGTDGIVNGGFFVFRKEFFRYLEDRGSMEQAPLRRLASDGQLAVYEHRGFWQAMDTFKEVETFHREWEHGNRPWVVWDGKGSDGG